ncbi:hypothetical protein SARC_05426 [Sphaeroforma arctica JP610]|uniref:Uncharacterized protein n=1 Tax=Sphaeroforma arctica JP610 TaxID=667725 RepID=A0A0L0FZM0_9EUKA|nr:hypothetical protein SARC_05426 [Sphaeroforma arctica JP610]KNC82292.1 hypothetical protein SARC_05426 [Sphaeroforma arctica JP610]|eukprot:XP_014156194.1 hypothetical protein SARC_05426 [Sphaeroforma arctica JP610]
MCRFFAIIFAAVLTAYSVFAAFFGIFSTSWWTGPNNYEIGIATNCGNTDEINGFCTDFTWDAFANSTERAMAGLLIASVILGLMCFCVMVFNIIFACCCINLAGPMTGILAVLNGLCLAAVCIVMGFYCHWEFPPLTDIVGSAFIIVIAAVPCTFIAAALTGVHSFRSYGPSNDYKA